MQDLKSKNRVRQGHGSCKNSHVLDVNPKAPNVKKEQAKEQCRYKRNRELMHYHVSRSLPLQPHPRNAACTQDSGIALPWHVEQRFYQDVNRSIAKLASKNKGKSKSSAMHPTPSAPQQDLSHPVVTFKTTAHPLLASSEIHSHIVFLHNQPTLT